MICSEKQLMILFDLAIWFSQLNMAWRDMGPPFSKETINQLINEIYNQQSNKLIEIK